MLQTNNQRRQLLVLAGLACTLILVTICAKYILGPTALSTESTKWLWGDLAQVQIAWIQFLNDQSSSWLSTNRLSHPIPISISLFDPLPIFLLAAKWLEFQPTVDQQFFGKYFLACLILQALIGFFAARKTLHLVGEEDNPFTILTASMVALLVATIPYTFHRFQGHTALSSQWILLLAIWSTLHSFEGTRIKWTLLNLPILTLAAGINPYLAAMALLNAAIMNFGITRRQGPTEYIIRIGLAIIATVFGFKVFGFLDAASTVTGGYGSFSMNLLGPIDSNGKSRLIGIDIVDPTGGQTFEGYTYLGAGAIILIAAAAAFLALTKTREKIDRYPSISSIAAIILFVALALSATVTVLNFKFSLTLPQPAFEYLSKFRASGRFFWMAGFLLIFSATAIVVATLGARKTSYFMVAMVAIQLIDIQPIAKSVRETIRAFSTIDPIQVSTRNISAVYVYPPWQCNPGATPGGLRNYESVGYLAAKELVPTNNFYAARTPRDQSKYHCSQKFETSTIDPKAVYLFAQREYRTASPHIAKTHLCRLTKGDNRTRDYWICEPAS